MGCYVVLFYVKLCHVMVYHIMLCDIVLPYVTQYHIIFCYVMLYCISSALTITYDHFGKALDTHTYTRTQMRTIIGRKMRIR